MGVTRSLRTCQTACDQSWMRLHDRPLRTASAPWRRRTVTGFPKTQGLGPENGAVRDCSGAVITPATPLSELVPCGPKARANAVKKLGVRVAEAVGPVAEGPMAGAGTAAGPGPRLRAVGAMNYEAAKQFFERGGTFGCRGSTSNGSLARTRRSGSSGSGRGSGTSGSRAATLSPERVELLSAIGMRWV